MDECIKCNSKTIKTKHLGIKCNCIVCIKCGYIEFYATKEDLEKFNEKRG